MSTPRNLERGSLKIKTGYLKSGMDIMDQGRILLKLICDKIGLGTLKLDTFDERLCLQKKIYCVQMAGLDLGYRYNWHIKGPYCPALTRVTFLLKEDIENDGKDLKKYILSSEAD